MSKRCPYQAIMIAAAHGRGVRLTPEEADQLSADNAIETVANNGLSEQEVTRWQDSNLWDFWRSFSKRRAPSPEPTLEAEIQRLRTDRDEWKAMATEYKSLTEEWQARAEAKPVSTLSRPDLRARVSAAIFDPGTTEGYKGDRTLTHWQTDAVMRALAATTEGSEQ